MFIINVLNTDDKAVLGVQFIYNTYQECVEKAGELSVEYGFIESSEDVMKYMEEDGFYWSGCCGLVISQPENS